MVSIRNNDEAQSLLRAVASRSASDIRFVDQLATEQTGVYFTMQPSPSGVSGVALHGFCPSGTVALFAPADKAAELKTFLEYNASATRTILRALSSTKTPGGLALPGAVRMLFPGDIVRFGQEMPQGVVVVVLNLNKAGIGFINTNVGLSAADAKIGGQAAIRWYFGDPGPQQRIAYVATAFRSPTINLDASTPPIFGNGQGNYLAPTAKKLLLRFVNTGSDSRLTTENIGLALWFRDMNDGYWCHHPADDLIDGARGNVTSQHDCETYALNGCVDMFAVVGTGVRYSYAIMDA